MRSSQLTERRNVSSSQPADWFPLNPEKPSGISMVVLAAPSDVFRWCAQHHFYAPSSGARSRAKKYNAAALMCRRVWQKRERRVFQHGSKLSPAAAYTRVYIRVKLASRARARALRKPTTRCLSASRRLLARSRTRIIKIYRTVIMTRSDIRAFARSLSLSLSLVCSDRPRSSPRRSP